MKIAFLLENIASSGGTERVTTLIANQLAKRGYNITLISLIKGESFFKLDSNIKITYVEKDNKRYISFIRQIFNTRKIISAINPDILINVGTNLSLFTFSISEKKTKIISWEHYIFERNFTAPRLKAGLWLTKRTAKKVILLSKKEALKWKYNKAIVINNPRSFTTERTPDYLSKKAIAIGHLFYNKGFDMLLKSWSIVIKKHPDAILYIYGQGEEEENLKILIQKLGLHNNVRIEKPTRDIINAYLNSSLFLMSSRSENQPMVLLEAMSCGLPVIAFDCPTGPGEILTNGVDGILIKPFEEEKYAEAIISFLNNPQKRIQYGTQGRKNVKRYDIEKITDQWEVLIKEVYLK